MAQMQREVRLHRDSHHLSQIVLRESSDPKRRCSFILRLAPVIRRCHLGRLLGSLGAIGHDGSLIVFGVRAPSDTPKRTHEPLIAGEGNYFSAFLIASIRGQDSIEPGL